MENTNIYTLSDPITNEVRYVGKTYKKIEERLYAHISECNTYIKSHKVNWIRSLLNKNLKPYITLVDIVPTTEWDYWEKYWIEQFKSWGFKLTNSTKGGKDNSHLRSREIIEKINKLRTIIDIPEKELYQKYIIENFSINKCSLYFNTSETTIFRNLKRYNITKDKEVWKIQLSTRPVKIVLQYDLEGNLLKEWPSLSEIDLDISNISNCCLGRVLTAGGYIWRYKDEFFEIDLEKLNYNKRKVSQYDLKGNFIENYDSITDVNLNGFSDNCVQSCCSGKAKSHAGFIWRYTEDDKPDAYTNKTIKKVLQYDLDGNFIKEWDTIVSVENELGFLSNGIGECCSGKRKTSYGYIWRYKDNFIEINTEGLKKQKVLQYDLDGNLIKVWETLTIASKELGVSNSGISGCCKGRVKSHVGFIWRYEGDDKPEAYTNKTIRRVLQYDLDGNFIKEWKSLVSVENELGFASNGISECCSGKRKTSYGYVWKYKSDINHPQQIIDKNVNIEKL